ncbi:MAG: type II toxin-antitoxin system RelE/ParE family toxin [Acidobacteria bacterium]|nr:type II toxin-antitoxin system RelE/ParE family toxin [Acidobacteriota bacterium]
MFRIEYAQEAVEDLKWFGKPEQQRIVEAIDGQLRYDPMVKTRNRKRMRPNGIAEWELRIGDFRVLYNVDQQVRIVEIRRIGEKRRNEIFFRGQKEDL